MTLRLCFYNDCLVRERLDRHQTTAHGMYCANHSPVQRSIPGAWNTVWIQCTCTLIIHRKCVCRQSILYVCCTCTRTVHIHVHVHCTCRHANNLTHSFALNTTCTVPQHMYIQYNVHVQVNAQSYTCAAHAYT